MSFWANYVLLKEQQEGVPRETTLSQIEAKLGTSKRQEIEQELANQPIQ